MKTLKFIIGILTIAILQSSCTKRINISDNSLPTNKVQNEIEKDYFHILMLLEEVRTGDELDRKYFQSQIKLQESNFSKNINLIGNLDSKTKKGQIVIELLKQTIQTFILVNSFSKGNLQKLRGTINSLNKRNKNTLKEINKLL